MPDDNRKNRIDAIRALSQIKQIGVMIVSCIGVGIFIGWLLDRWLGTSPWILLIFTILGIIAAFRSIFDFAKNQK